MTQKEKRRRAGDTTPREVGNVENIPTLPPASTDPQAAPIAPAFHPLADLFPLIEGAEFDDLVADIRANGLREPVVLYEGQILDGRNRFRACAAAGIACQFEQYQGSDPVGYVISLNLRRRHLDESQRAMVAAKLATLRDGQRADLVEGLPIGRASELLNVGDRSVARAREVLDHGAPELQHAVEHGEVSVSAAADIATLSVEDQRAILAKVDKREILRVSQEIRAEKAKARRTERDARLIEISKGNTDLPHDRRYPVILADPPWQFSVGGANDPRAREPRNHYQTMPTQDICDMQIGEKIATPDAVLFLWVPAGLLFVHGAAVLDAWGFEYRSNIVWAKDHDLSETARRFGLGFYCRTQHEHLLIATRGERLTPNPSDLSSSVIYAPRREHSRKPDEAYEIIERMYPTLPKIELFARNRREGWAAWGNEAPAAEQEVNPFAVPDFLLRSAP